MRTGGAGKVWLLTDDDAQQEVEKSDDQKTFEMRERFCKPWLISQKLKDECIKSFELANGSLRRHRDFGSMDMISVSLFSITTNHHIFGADYYQAIQRHLLSPECMAAEERWKLTSKNLAD